MKNLIVFTFSLLTIGLIHSPLFAQTQEEVQVGATIGSPLEITKSADLHFGDIVAGATAGTLTIDTDGNITTTGGTETFTFGDNDPSVATFDLKGMPWATVAVSLPDDNEVVLTNQHGNAETMTLINFTTNFTDDKYTFTPPAKVELKVAATIEVGADQEPGDYVGEFDVILNYE